MNQETNRQNQTINQNRLQKLSYLPDGIRANLSFRQDAKTVGNRMIHHVCGKTWRMLVRILSEEKTTGRFTQNEGSLIYPGT